MFQGSFELLGKHPNFLRRSREVEKEEEERGEEEQFSIQKSLPGLSKGGLGGFFFLKKKNMHFLGGLGFVGRMRSKGLLSKRDSRKKAFIQLGKSSRERLFLIRGRAIFGGENWGGEPRLGPPSFSQEGDLNCRPGKVTATTNGKKCRRHPQRTRRGRSNHIQECGGREMSNRTRGRRGRCAEGPRTKPFRKEFSGVGGSL